MRENKRSSIIIIETPLRKSSGLSFQMSKSLTLCFDDTRLNVPYFQSCSSENIHTATVYDEEI